MEQICSCLKEKCWHCDRLKLNANIVLFAGDKNTKTNACFDDILLNAFLKNYKCRLNKIKPNIKIFFSNNNVKLIYKIDKYVHYRDMQTDKFDKKLMLYSGIDI